MERACKISTKPFRRARENVNHGKWHRADDWRALRAGGLPTDDDEDWWLPYRINSRRIPRRFLLKLIEFFYLRSFFLLFADIFFCSPWLNYCSDRKIGSRVCAPGVVERKWINERPWAWLIACENMRMRWQIELVENVTDLAYRFLSFQICLVSEEDEMAGALIAKLIEKGTYLHEFCLL